ncbi:TraR/DksA family transcriptional regulator [Actinomadura viridis]|uniref:TraR/DksA family transcriptional regulator n=1 Tax=Actinomadura viridis TaxID=58110 RepID=UPI0036B6EEA2
MATSGDGTAAKPALDGAAVRELRQRLREDRVKRASELAALEKVVEGTAPGQVEPADYTRMDNLRQSLTEIDGALRRLEEGTYGVCEGCGQAIPAGRLEILPHVRCCVRCQGRIDGGGR